MATLRLLVSVFAFTGVLAGCIAAVILLVLVWRFPPLLLALLAATWLFSLLPGHSEHERSVMTAQPTPPAISPEH